VPTTTARGRAAEAFAERWLSERGLTPVERNLRLAGAEIDLVMRDGETWVFVEVRHRENVEYGEPAATVSDGKRRRLQRAADCWMAEQPPEAVGRFDVLGISGPLHAPEEIDWISDAFDAI
jgi:putative endonuclease